VKKENSLKNYFSNSKIMLVIFTIWPIIFFAIADSEYWEVMKEDFGLNNTWYAIAINIQTTHSGGTYSYLFPNIAFILYVITVISLNGAYYSILKRKNS